MPHERCFCSRPAAPGQRVPDGHRHQLRHPVGDIPREGSRERRAPVVADYRRPLDAERVEEPDGITDQRGHAEAAGSMAVGAIAGSCVNNRSLIAS